MRKGIFERAYLNWRYRKDILMKDISERAFLKGISEMALKGRSFWGKGISEGPKGNGYEGQCAWTRNFPRNLLLAIYYLPVIDLTVFKLRRQGQACKVNDEEGYRWKWEIVCCKNQEHEVRRSQFSFSVELSLSFYTYNKIIWDDYSTGHQTIIL